MSSPTRVKDIVPGQGSSSPYLYTSLNNILFFAAEDANSGRELWRSDGTSIGTYLVKDIANGSPSSYTGEEATVVNGILFFTADDGSSGQELWKSDGTEAGTVLVKNIASGSGSSYPDYLTSVNGTLFFSAMSGDGAIGGVGNGSRELWKSDGSSAGTVLIKDIRPGDRGSYPSWLTDVDRTLFFAAFEPSTGTELWKSDGTPSGTVLVKDILPGTSSFNPWSLINYGGEVFFFPYTGDAGVELWKSNGTETGTVLVKAINTSLPSTIYDRDPCVVGNTLFFAVDDGTTGYELWGSDGTPSGTSLLKNINPGSDSSAPSSLIDVNGKLFFTANNGSLGRELWVSDGTTQGTTLVKDINPGNAWANPYDFAVVNNILFFSANDGSSGRELWKSDGTPNGTVRVMDINIGAGGSAPSQLTVIGNTLFFAASDASGGRELWRYEVGPVSTNNGPATFTINGTYQVGATLVAVNSAPDPDGNGVFSYFWESSNNGTTWTGIGSNSPSLLLTNNEVNKQVRINVSYADGEGFNESISVLGDQVVVDTSQQGDPVYRFFKKGTGSHLYTQQQERDILLGDPITDPITGSLVYEGPTFREIDDGVATQRFYNASSSTHINTIVPLEQQLLRQSPDWVYEGESYEVSRTFIDGVAEVEAYRFRNIQNGAFLYSVEPFEINILNNNPSFLNEGIAFYVGEL